MTRLALDAMGSDLGPAATVAGAAAVSLRDDAPHLTLVGDAALIQAELARNAHAADRIRVVHAPAVVPMDASPREALDARPDASVLVAARLVANGEADVLVSAGNTGAVTLACARTFARLPGVARAALGAVVPTELRRGERRDPFSLLLDAGLTLDPTADDLVAFALMGAAYAERISKNPRPSVALLSNGAEPGKGPPAVVEAHARLAAHPTLHFIGNVEGMDIPRGTADVVVTGGFVGNIVLKMLEGVSDTVMRTARAAGERRWRYAAGLWLLSPAIRRVRQVTDWQQYGGVPILGFDRLCIKAHGRSTARAISNALKVATITARTDLVGGMRAALEARG
ncbi:MAG: phosphate acyltransferase PlsX [Pseudomonadota bacterium]|nr:phosphate acyltransferase PlsX [Pseudomonadota bacterium]